MKKILIILFCLTSSLAGKAQNIQGQLLVGKALKATAEVTAGTDNLYSYTYLETSEAYYWLQQIVEVNFYKQWAAHLEYRTGDVFLAGIAKSFTPNNWFFSLCALGRYEHKSLTGQIGAFWEYNKNKVNIYGYIDGWYSKMPCMYLEQRFYYEIAKGFSIGGVVNVSKGQSWEVMPYFGMRVKFN